MDTFKIISIIFMMLVLYQIYVLNCTVFKDKVEGFEGATQSLGGVDDTNAINTLAQIAKNLMAGGASVPGAINLSNGKTKFPLVNDGDNVFRIKDDGGKQLLAISQGGGIWSKDNGLILNGGDLTLTGNESIGGGLSVGGNTNLAGLATPLKIIKGTASPDNTKFQWGDGTGWRLRFQKDDSNPTMDVYDNGSVNITRSLVVGGRDILAELNEIKNNYVRFETRNVSFKPNPDPDRCFDFGSSGRTGCDNGWSIGMLTKR